MTKNTDRIWTDLISRYHLDLGLPLNVVTQEQIDSVRGKTDLRNVVSMTSTKDWATPLRQKGVSVLGKSRTEWMLVHGKGYEKLDDPGEPETFHSRAPIKLMTLSYGRGENPFLNHALHSGVLREFTGVSALFETLSGRSGTPEFRFRMDNLPGLTNLPVAQGTIMEIDKGYEGQNELVLFEAKARPQPDFFIRQLYYPYRSLRQRLADHKKVRSCMFVADPNEATYSFWEFEWREPDDYQDIRLAGRPRSFRIVEEEVPKDAFTNVEPVRAIPEIQANDLEKVMTLPFLIPQGIDTAMKWVKYQGWSKWPRQGNYYGSAAAALGLIRSEDGRFILTDEGKRFVTLSPPERDLIVVERLLEVPTINRVFLRAQERGNEGVTSAEVARIIEETQGLRGTTPARRASTVLAWFRWLAVATGTVAVEGQRIYSRVGWERRQSTH